MEHKKGYDRHKVMQVVMDAQEKLKEAGLEGFILNIEKVRGGDGSLEKAIDGLDGLKPNTPQARKAMEGVLDADPQRVEQLARAMFPWGYDQRSCACPSCIFASRVKVEIAKLFANASLNTIEIFGAMVGILEDLPPIPGVGIVKIDEKLAQAAKGALNDMQRQEGGSRTTEH